MSGHLDVQAIDPGAGEPTRSWSTRCAASSASKVWWSPTRSTWSRAKAVPGNTAVQALLAGNDLRSMPTDPAHFDNVEAGIRYARQGMLDALASGQLPHARLVEAVTRILTLKFELDSEPRPEMSIVDSADHRAAAAAVAAAAMTVLGGILAPAPWYSGPILGHPRAGARSRLSGYPMH